MNQGTSRQYTEFVFRRLTEPFSIFGQDLPSTVWLFILALVLLVGLIYVAVMYARDAVGLYRQGGGMPWWLAIPFLLPWLFVPPLIGLPVFVCIFYLVRRDLQLPSWLVVPGVLMWLLLPQVVALFAFVSIVALFVRPDGALVRALLTANLLGMLRM